jgi:alpha-L-rhamnosidase
MNWQARMIGANEAFSGAPLFRRDFSLRRDHGPVARASLTLTALGIVEAWLNGQLVSDDLLTPGWSSYEWRLRYATYDITHLLEEDTNAIGLALGNGWYAGRLTWTGRSKFYGEELGASAQLEVTFADGTTQLVVTDETWAAGPSAVLANDLYDGQTIDARLRDDDWSRPGFHGREWVGVHPLKFDTGKLAAYLGPKVIRWNELPVPGGHHHPVGEDGG